MVSPYLKNKGSAVRFCLWPHKMNNNKNKLFGSYDGFEYQNVDSLKISIDTDKTEIDDIYSLINQKYAIEYRDELIAYYLKKNNLYNLFDIGADNCSLLIKSKNLGINVSGIDVDDKSILISNKYDLNVKKFSMKELFKFTDIYHFFDKYEIKYNRNEKLVISCLNILHGKWEDKNLKNNIVDFLFENADILIITCDDVELYSYIKKYKIEKYFRIHHHKNIVMKKIFFTSLQYGLNISPINKYIKGLLVKLNSKFNISPTLSSYKFPDKINAYAALPVIIETSRKNKIF